MNNLPASQQIHLLKEAHRATGQRRYADRIKSILPLSKGYSFEETAAILMVDNRSIRKWKLGYDEHRIDQLLQDNYQGSSPKLLIA